ncbi:MAG: AMP-binding protein, partial [Gammaproteobacteria bacterium]
MEKLAADLRPEQYSSLTDVLDYVFSKHGDRPAFACFGTTFSYAEIDALSDRFAAYLINETPLQAGDRIAIQLPNILQFPVALYGALKAGLV